MVNRNARVISGTKVIEWLTGLYTLVLSMWIWISDAFTYTLQTLSHLAGLEPIVALIGSSFGVYQMYASVAGYVETRAWVAFGSTCLCALMLAGVYENLTWRVFGVPSLALSVTTQAVIFLKLKAYIHG